MSRPAAEFSYRQPFLILRKKIKSIGNNLNLSSVVSFFLILKPLAPAPPYLHHGVGLGSIRFSTELKGFIMLIQ